MLNARRKKEISNMMNALYTGCADKIVAIFFFYKKQHKKHILKLFIKKSKTGDRYTRWAAIYSIKSPLASITA